MMSSLSGVFAGGDFRMGHSLLVWAIGEGRDLARAVDTYLRQQPPAGQPAQQSPAAAAVGVAVEGGVGGRGRGSGIGSSNR